MNLAVLPLAYLGWHYTLALRDLGQLSTNLLTFVYRFFSLPTLAKTFFAPWRRLGETYKKGFYPGAWLETFILNSLMRLFGIFFRTILIISGSVVWLAALLVAVFAWVGWLLLPLVVPVLFFSGLHLLLL